MVQKSHRFLGCDGGIWREIQNYGVVYGCKTQRTVASSESKEEAQKVYDISDEAISLIADRVETHKIDCDLKWGYLHAAPRTSDFEEMREEKEYLEGYGATGIEVLDKSALEERLGSTTYHGALREERAGHLHPLNYCLGLAEAAVGAGARIFEHSPAIDVDTGPNPSAKTAGGKVSAKFMVVAGNAYSIGTFQFLENSDSETWRHWRPH